MKEIKVLFLQPQPCVRGLKYAEGLKWALKSGVSIYSGYLRHSLNHLYGYGDGFLDGLIEMEGNPKLVLASGDIEGKDSLDVTARGIGRFVRNSIFKELGGCYPPHYGYEAWMIHRALQLGYEARGFSEELRFKHLRRMRMDMISGTGAFR